MRARRIPTRWALFARDTGGTAAAEMALILPIVAFITLNVVDVANFAYSKMQVDIAAQQAVGIVRVKCTNAATLNAGTCGTTYASAMQSAAESTTLGANVTLSGTPTEGLYCAQASGSLVSTTAADCSGVVTGSTAKPGSYISATYSYAYSSIFPGASVASLISSPIQATAWMRLK